MKVYVLLEEDFDKDRIHSIFKNEKDAYDMLANLGEIHFNIEEHEIIE